MKMWRRMLVAVLAVALLGAACGSDDDGGDGDATTDTTAGAGTKLTVGSANFDESTVVASMYSQVLENAGYDVEEEFGIGSREVYFEALKAGELDLVPEFVGTLTVFLKGTGDADEMVAVENLKKVLPEGIQALEPSPAASANVFVVTEETAAEHSLEKISDLAGKGLSLGGPPECPQREFCMLGLETVYDLDFTDAFKPLDAGGPITKEALTKGDIDVALLFSTDPGIVENGWVVLEDDKHLQPAENVIPVIVEESADEEVVDLLNKLSAALDQDAYVELLGKIYIDGEDAADVAQEWLEENDFL